MQSFRYSRQQKVETLIDFLVRRFPYQSEAAWKTCIHNGEVKVNARETTWDRVLQNRDTISYDRPREREPKVDGRYELLFQDQVIVVAAKSGNLPISDSGKYHYNTLLHILQEREGYEALYPVHRLDRETSGIVLFARSPKSAAALGEQFARHIPRKIYHAVLVGMFESAEYLVDQPLKRCSLEQSCVLIRQVVDPGGRESKTLFQRERVANGLTLARISPFTGRTHQIRCHADFLGHPVLGDKLYGQSDVFFLDLQKNRVDPIFESWGRIDRQLLHASALSLYHPETHEWLSWQADYRPQFEPYEAVKPLLD